MNRNPGQDVTVPSMTGGVVNAQSAKASEDPSVAQQSRDTIKIRYQPFLATSIYTSATEPPLTKLCDSLFVRGCLVRRCRSVAVLSQKN